jgi:hypothetical protein
MKRVLAGVFATLFVLSVAHAYYVRVDFLRTRKFALALNPGHLQQVETVRRHVPPGSTILYVDDQEDAWNMGLFRRSLYPDYVLLPATSGQEIRARRQRNPRPDYPVRGAIVTRRYQGERDFTVGIPLPENSVGVPVDLGMWN